EDELVPTGFLLTAEGAHRGQETEERGKDRRHTRDAPARVAADRRQVARGAVEEFEGRVVAEALGETQPIGEGREFPLVAGGVGDRVKDEEEREAQRADARVGEGAQRQRLSLWHRRLLRSSAGRSLRARVRDSSAPRPACPPAPRARGRRSPRG